MAVKSLNESSLNGLVSPGGILGKDYSEGDPCPYRENCSLYQKDAITEKMKKNTCDHDPGVGGNLRAPRIGWIHDTDQGTLCDVYIGKKALEYIKALSEKINNASIDEKFDLGGL